MFTASFKLVSRVRLTYFWNNERWKSYNKYLSTINYLTCRNVFQSGANDTAEMV